MTDIVVFFILIIVAGGVALLIGAVLMASMFSSFLSRQEETHDQTQIPPVH